MINRIAPSLSRKRLWAEFTGIFIIAPLVLALFLPPNWMFPMLFVVTVIGIVLLHRTQGFHWHELLRGMREINWRFVGLFTVITVIACYIVIVSFAPGALFVLARQEPLLLLMIVLLYPVLSALPQELVFRPLFFRRYGAILPPLRAAIVLNAAIFALAHLMYWSMIVVVMTFVGGLIFAKAYEGARNFPQAVILHAIAGNLIFVFGLGIYFYSGNVTRPF